MHGIIGIIKKESVLFFKTQYFHGEEDTTLHGGLKISKIKERKNMKKILAAAVSAVMSVSVIVPVRAAEKTLSDDIVILYTNDVHTYIDGDLSYDVIAAVKKDLREKYKYVLLADAGDHIQGTAYGSMDKGESIIRMMNAAEYDVATPGNHEFDYDMEGFVNAAELADFPYISANFYYEENGVRTENVFDSFLTFDCGDERVAFVGITTPETFEKSTPAYFRDGNGNFIYGISGGTDGAELRADVQSSIDEARAGGATKVIALGHLGVDPSSEPWTSVETIENVSGLDAFIDGHSHSTIEGERITDKDGNEVLLTQTGNYFDRIGIMVIDSETDEIRTDFIECENVLAEDGETVIGKRLSSELYDGSEIISDSAVKELKDNHIEKIDEQLGEKIGTASVTLDNYDEEGNRLVRSAETNSGDFAADALYYLFDDMDMDIDGAVMNGGGIRNTAVSGDISYKTCKDIHTFGNVACLQKMKGRQLLNALEWGARKLDKVENGCFFQVSGITYKIDISIDNTVKEDEIGIWIGEPEKYRVYDVNIYNRETNEYEPLDENAEYNIAGYNYTLRNLGDGCAMFDGAVNVLDYVSEDYLVLANYVKGFEGGVIEAENSPLKKKYPSMLLDYGTVNGSGRIEISEKPKEDATANGFADVDETAWYYDNVSYVTENKLMNGITDTEFVPEASVTRGMLVTVLYRAEGEPEVNQSIAFTDVTADSYYANSVAWAKQNGITDGVTDTEFVPDGNITREQIAAIMFRYAKFKGYDVSVGEDTNILSYTDFDGISEYAVAAMQYAVGSELITGKTDDELNPKDEATRAEIAAIMQRFIESNV